jgi:hypothetical protein
MSPITNLILTITLWVATICPPISQKDKLSHREVCYMPKILQLRSEVSEAPPEPLYPAGPDSCGLCLSESEGGFGVALMGSFCFTTLQD